MKTLFEVEKRKRNIPKPPKDSIPYRPSNGAEGDYFELINCHSCKKYRNCSILARAYGGASPKQWVTTINGDNICISKEKYGISKHNSCLFK